MLSNTSSEVTSEDSSILEEVLGELEVAVPAQATKPAKLEKPSDQRSLRDLVVYERAHGASIETISTKLGLEREAIQMLTEQPWFLEKMLKVQAAENMPLALQVKLAAQFAHERRLYIMLFSKDAKTVASIAGDYLDRELGKPVQRTESMNLNYNVESSEVETRLERATKRLDALKQQKQNMLNRTEPINV